MWCRNLLKHTLQAITCIQEDPGYGKYHGLEDSDDHQHVLRASLQTYICMKSDTAQPPEKSALDFGWEDQNGLSPVYFVTQTSSDFPKDLLCTCKGKSSCSQGCVCVFFFIVYIIFNILRFIMLYILLLLLFL
jgi:hypothetical protein